MGSFSNPTGGTTHMSSFVQPSPASGGPSFFGPLFPPAAHSFFGGLFPNGAGGVAVASSHMTSFSNPTGGATHMPSFVQP